ncbi:MAG: GNAT family N-acetyltransferase [Solobacterium sp.]|nr:GNAT family N-acetyltransferase [Solobacterium sp.]
MNRDYFLTTERIGFSRWTSADSDLAELLWGDEKVTHYICSSGRFSQEDIKARLELEVRNDTEQHVQYWPVFELSTGKLIGCCGLRPFGTETYEIGFHLRPEFWRRGYAPEAANAVIDYAFSVLHAEAIYAGHHPENHASRRVLQKLGFRYIGDNYYQPTGLYHPSYELKR